MKITISILNPGYLVEYETANGQVKQAAFSGFQGLLAHIQPLCVGDAEAVTLVGTGRSRLRQVIQILQTAGRPMRAPEIAAICASEEPNRQITRKHWITRVAAVLCKAVDRRTPGIARIAPGLYIATSKTGETEKFTEPEAKND